MAQITRYINTDSTPGGTGITNATSGTDRAYASASEWEAAEETDLVTAGDNHVVYASAPSGVADGAFTINGWVTGSGNDILFSGNNDGIAKNQANAYWVDHTAAASFSYVVRALDPYVTFEGIQVAFTNPDPVSYPYCYGITLADDYCTARNCLVYSKSGTDIGGTEAYAYYCDFKSGLKIYNTTAANWDYGYYIKSNSGTAASYFAHNTAYSNNTYGVYLRNDADGTGYIRNLLAISNGTDFYNGGSLDIDYCMSSDASAPGTNSITNATVSFSDAANDDFHLLSTDDAVDAGTDLSSDPNLSVDTDGEGDTRPSGTTSDIGADEYVASGGTDTVTVTTGTFSTFSGGSLSLSELLHITAGSWGVFTGSTIQLSELLTIPAGVWAQIVPEQYTLFDTVNIGNATWAAFIGQDLTVGSTDIVIVSVGAFSQFLGQTIKLSEITHIDAGTMQRFIGQSLTVWDGVNPVIQNLWRTTEETIEQKVVFEEWDIDRDVS